MTIEEKLLVIQEELDKTGIFKASGIHQTNHRPHMYTVTDVHTKTANDENKGVLSEEILERLKCGHPQCTTKYSEHMADNQLIIQLKKDVTQKETKGMLLEIQNLVKTLNIKSIAFAESDQGYEFL